jgi:hypothetical protein
MVFTLEQNKFLMMSSYRNGVKRDEEWTYSVQASKEEFLAKYYSGHGILANIFLTFLKK